MYLAKNILSGLINRLPWITLIFLCFSVVTSPINITPVGEDVIASYPEGIVGAASSFNEDDGYSIAIVATKLGDIQEIFYKSTDPKYLPSVGRSTIANFADIKHVSSFYAKDDQYRIVIVATSDGDIHEVFYHPDRGRGQSVIAHFEGIIGMSAFYAEDDAFRIVIVATKDGDIHEVFYHPDRGKGQSVIAHYENINCITATYLKYTNDRCVLISKNDNSSTLFIYSPNHSSKEITTTFQNTVNNMALTDNGRLIISFNSGELALGTFYTSFNYSIGLYKYVKVDQIDQVAIYSTSSFDNIIYTTKDGNVHKYLWDPNPPPTPKTKITQFTASPNNGYINVGDNAYLNWVVTDCGNPCNISITAKDGVNYQDILFSKPGLPSTGTMTVSPNRSTLTKYILNANGPNGQDSKEVVVQLYLPPGSVPVTPGCTPFYFKLFNPNSLVCKCYVVAYCQKDEETARQQAEYEYSDYKATPISYGEFVTGCPCN